jgi:hypothetical protein
MTTTITEEEFFGLSSSRRCSGELDFGVMWRASTTKTWPLYRVSYIRDTGEFYAICLGPKSHGGGMVELLGRIDPAGGYEAAEAILTGWADQTPNVLDWARARMPRQEA